ncbi:T9SS type A sorting domain-containing protein [Polaribacter sp.]|uniref:T9SS type A sorting domain-containing protein n=1 Tax=Polaribacter sp. TaxID=1920175 RepID=UPI003F6BE9A4
MKNFLLSITLAFVSAISYSQTFPVHDIDECVVITEGFNQNATYDQSVANPVPADASTNVSRITPDTSGNTTTHGIYFTLPYRIPRNEAVSFSVRTYVGIAGSGASGSGLFKISIQATDGSGNIAASNVTLGQENNTGGSWQTISGSGLNLTTGNTTTDNAIDAAGGFDVLVIQQVNPGSSEVFYFDNVEFQINPNLADVTADLDPGNLWLYNNREGDNQLAASSEFNGSVTENVTTPSTNGNSASTVLQFNKTGSFSVLEYAIPPIQTPFSGTVKLRVYLDACTLDNTNNRIQVRLRTAANEDTNTAPAGVISIDKRWTELSFDLSTITGTSSTDYTKLQIIVDGGAANNTYFFDAIQGPFAGATTFTGADNNSWTNAANWTNGVPNALFDATIQTGNNVGIFNAQTSVNNLTLEGDASVFLQGTAPELTVQGTVTLGTGDFNFRRTLASSNWYLMSAPFGGDISDFQLATGQGSNVGVGTYNTATNDWTYKQASATFTTTTGVGFSVKKDAAGRVQELRGTTLNTSDVSVAVSNAGSGFNLLGNPFASSINSDAFLTANTGNLVSQTIWVWNQATSNYEAKVTADAFVLAPTQGFFARANASTNLTIAKGSQATGGTFQKAAKQEVRLQMTDGSSERFARILYDENATTDFDNGYDGEVFGGIANELDVYTNLVAKSEGKKYQIQGLPNTGLEDMVVPVGITAEAGKTITFTATANNLPTELNVYLEDRLNNTFTKLDENSEYTVTLDAAVDGSGRFFLHTASSVLSTDDVALTGVNIYPANNNLRVTGVNSTEANVAIYNILGKKVLDQDFTSRGTTAIRLPKLSLGVYIVNLTTEKGKISKKIVLE